MASVADLEAKISELKAEQADFVGKVDALLQLLASEQPVDMSPQIAEIQGVIDALKAEGDKAAPAPPAA